MREIKENTPVQLHQVEDGNLGYIPYLQAHEFPYRHFAV